MRWAESCRPSDLLYSVCKLTNLDESADHRTFGRPVRTTSGCSRLVYLVMASVYSKGTIECDICATLGLTWHGPLPCIAAGVSGTFYYVLLCCAHHLTIASWDCITLC